MRTLARWLALVVALSLVGWASPASAPGAATNPLHPLAARAGHHAWWFPPYDPAKNYCGPEWLQEAGLGFLVPREPIAGYDFSPACYAHDACYSDCCQNGMSQAACDAQFLVNMTNTCATTTATMVPWWYPGKVCVFGDLLCYLAQSRYGDCVAAAGAYATAVSYLGDGIVETEPLAATLAAVLTPLVGATVAWVGAYAVLAVVGDIQIEAAYPCPCLCLNCPADQQQAAPTCVESVLRGAFVTQTVTRYEKQGSNVSGVGPVCECVPREVEVVTPCPAGVGCDEAERVCASDVCSPETCHQAGVESHCTTSGLVDVLVTEWTWSACRQVDDYRSQCVLERQEIGRVTCPGRCAPDERSCGANHRLGTARLQVSEPASYWSTTLVPCRGCWMRLEGAAGAFTGRTDGSGNLDLFGVPEGTYTVSYGCGRSGLGPHVPSALASSSASPAFWFPVEEPFMVAQAPVPTVVVPTPGRIPTVTGRCGQPVCSAVDLSPTPTEQSLPPAVAATRRQIIEAAVACNYEALAALAASPYFLYAPGQSGDPAGYWRAQEEGPMGVPLLSLVETLNMPFGVVEVEGDVQYVWPAAWAEDPAYAGPRVMIHYTGEWLAYLAGSW